MHWLHSCPSSNSPDSSSVIVKTLRLKNRTFFLSPDSFSVMSRSRSRTRFTSTGGFNWIETPEVMELRDSPDAIAQATTEQLSHLLTVLIRQERFCEGSLESAFGSGLLTGIVRRAATIY